MYWTLTAMTKCTPYSLTRSLMAVTWRWRLLSYVIAVCLLTTVKSESFQCDFRNDKCRMENLPYCDFNWHLGQGNINANYKDRPTGAKACIATPISSYVGRVCASFNVYNSGPMPVLLEIEAATANSAEEHSNRYLMWSSTIDRIGEWHQLVATLEVSDPRSLIVFVVKAVAPASTGVMAINDISITPGCCDMDNCPANWLDWSDWSECVTNCSHGTKSRKRICDKLANVFMSCDGHSFDVANCQFDVDCLDEWMSWQPWTSCRSHCNSGTTERTRTCLRESCSRGSSTESRPCVRDRDCPGVSWTEFYCDFESDVCGLTNMNNTCNSLWRRSFGKLKVDVANNETACTSTPDTRLKGRFCVKFKIEVSGHGIRFFVIAIPRNASTPPERLWGTAVTHGFGVRSYRTQIVMHRTISKLFILVSRIQTRHTTIVQVDDLHIRRGCCDADDCPARWGQWQAWSQCSTGCGAGEKQRTRRCHGTARQGPCLGEINQTMPCVYDRDCSSTPTWSEWTAWIGCYPRCDSGVKQRLRTCINSHCQGNRTESIACNASDDCPEQETPNGEEEPAAGGDSNTMFACSFEYGNCEMTNLPFCNFTWSFASRASAAITAHNGNGYLVVDYNNRQPDTEACVATPVSYYDRRVCISFYVYLTGPSVAMLSIEAFPVGANPTKRGQHSVYGTILKRNQTWHLHEASIFLTVPSSRLSFVAVAAGVGFSGQLAIDDFNITRGCCSQVACVASWERWSDWGACDEGCGFGSKTRTRLCNNPSSGTFCHGTSSEVVACDMLIDCPASVASSVSNSMLGFLISLALAVRDRLVNVCLVKK